MLTDHADHGEDVKAYSEGMNLIRKEITDKGQKIKSQVDTSKKELSDIQNNIRETDCLKSKLKAGIAHFQNIIASYQEKIDVAACLVSQVENTLQRDGANCVSQYNTVIDKLAEKMSNASAILSSDDMTLLSKYKSEKQYLDEVAEKPLFYTIPAIKPNDEACQIEATIPDIAIAKDFSSPSLIYEIKESDEVALGAPVDIALAEDDTGYRALFVPDNKNHNRLKFSENGKCLLKCNSGTADFPQGVSCYNGWIYFAMFWRIERVDTAKHPKKVVFEKCPVKIRSIYAENPTKIIISEFSNPGGIHEYNPEENSARVVVENLHSPTYITKVTTKKDLRYIVTINDDHCLHVYNEDWQFQNSIGKGKGTGDGELNFPQGVAITHKGTALVADYGNNRICEFDVDGTFLRNLLTRKEGVRVPCGLAFKAPYLWITEWGIVGGNNHAAIKCFKVLD